MRALAQTIPDVDVLLALEPEELGAKMLFIMRQLPGAVPFQSNGMLNRNNAENEFREGSPTYQSRWPEVSLAFTEAWAWLEAQGLLVPAEGMNGTNGWRLLSRRAKAFESEAEFKRFTVARSLPKDALHPRIQQKVWMAFVRGEFGRGNFPGDESRGSRSARRLRNYPQRRRSHATSIQAGRRPAYRYGR